MERHEYRAFQANLKAAVLGGTPDNKLVDLLAETEGVPAEDRLQIHHNNYRETLSESLAGVFPALEAFVGTVFVKGALSEFCLANPPTGAALSGYGADFASFIEEHRASEQLPYIADIVRLEWALHELQLIREEPLDISGKQDLAISPNVRIIASNYPLMSLWSVASGQIPPEAVHLEQGGQTVAVVLKGGEISLVALDALEANLISTAGDTKSNVISGEDEENAAIIQALVKKNILAPA